MVVTHSDCSLFSRAVRANDRLFWWPAHPANMPGRKQHHRILTWRQFSLEDTCRWWRCHSAEETGNLGKVCQGWVERGKKGEDDDHTETSQQREEVLGRLIRELGTANTLKPQGIVGRQRWSRPKWTLGLMTFMVGTPHHAELKKQEVKSCSELRFDKISAINFKSGRLLSVCWYFTTVQQPNSYTVDCSRLTATHSEVTYRRLCR